MPYAQQTPNQTVPPDAAQIQPLLKRMTARLSGKVVWKGQDLTQTNVSVYRDEKLRGPLHERPRRFKKPWQLRTPRGARQVLLGRLC